MKIIIGLGNPGQQYQLTRHNIGFMLVDKLYDTYRFTAWQNKFQANIAQGVIEDSKVLLVKPQTLMNLSGRSVEAIVNFYKLDLSSLLIIHDDLALQFQQIRIKTGGGHGGHNGLRSIDQHVGNDYKRLRLGIGHPGNKDMVSSYVLHPFATEELDSLQPLLQTMAEFFPLMLADEDNRFIQKIITSNKA